MSGSSSRPKDLAPLELADKDLNFLGFFIPGELRGLEIN